MKTYDRLWNKERTAKWSNEKNKAPQRTEELRQEIHQPRKRKSIPWEVKKTPNSRGLFNLSARYSPERLDSNENVPHVHVWAEVFRSTWWHFCTRNAVQKGRLFVTARNPKDHSCWILWSETESAVKITHLSTLAQQWSLSQKNAEIQLRNGRIKERRVKTQELFKKNERKRQPYTKLFILNPDN